MEWTAILTAVLTFIGGGGLGAVLMFPTKRKAAELENEQKASEQWRELFMQKEQNCKEQSNLIDRLYDNQGKLRDEINRLTTEVAVLKILKCKNLNCAEREPPIADNAAGAKKEERKDETE